MTIRVEVLFRVAAVVIFSSGAGGEGEDVALTNGLVQVGILKMGWRMQRLCPNAWTLDKSAHRGELLIQKAVARRLHRRCTDFGQVHSSAGRLQRGCGGIML